MAPARCVYPPPHPTGVGWGGGLYGSKGGGGLYGTNGGRGEQGKYASKGGAQNVDARELRQAHIMKCTPYSDLFFLAYIAHVLGH